MNLPVESQDDNTETQGTLSPGNRAIFRLKYQITEQAASSGLVANQLKVNAKGPVNPDTSTFTEVSDLSEDPEDASFDPLVNQDNNTITLLSAVKSMKVEKRVEAQDTNNDGVIEAGDKLVYTITVENDGEVNLFSLFLKIQFMMMIRLLTLAMK